MVDGNVVEGGSGAYQYDPWHHLISQSFLDHLNVSRTTLLHSKGADDVVF
jgi:hypothetical protein